MCDAECDAVSESDRVFEREVVSEFDADCVSVVEFVLVTEAVTVSDFDEDLVSEEDIVSVAVCDGEAVIESGECVSDVEEREYESVNEPVSDGVPEEV